MKRFSLFQRRHRRRLPQHQHKIFSSVNYNTPNRQLGAGRLLLSPATIVLLYLFFLGAIGVVSPFAGGSTADVGGGTNSVRPKQGVAHQLYPPPHQQHATATTTTTTTTTPLRTNRATNSPLFRSSTPTVLPLAAAEASTDTIPTLPLLSSLPTPTKTNKSSSIFRRILWNLNPLPGRKDDRWKGGESQATLASRLLFSYVSPLLDVAANRTLTEHDALAVSEQLQMNVAVPKLAETYDEARRRAIHTLETNRRSRRRVNGTNKCDNNNNNNDDYDNHVKKKNSQTWILLQTLFQYQRSALIFTGCLRLLNTAIQAFPAIIVARLLRSIEAGTAEPVSKSVHAALLLVGVLSIKMIVENQLFHHVVTMSTQVRGALEGLIFDKSLKLPEGGRGVMARQNLSTEKKALGSGGVGRV
jgi:hypothetical protein